MVRQYVDPPTIYRSPIYSQAVRAGDLIFVAGQCATAPPDGDPVTATRSPTILGPADSYAQARQCYQNVQWALEAAGGRMQDVLKINTYATHPAWRGALAEVRSEFFAPPYPASTGLVVTSLFKPEARFEIEVIAVAADAARERPLAHVDPPLLHKPPQYSQVVRAGDLVFVAGQCAYVPGDGAAAGSGVLVGAGDPLIQARQCHENVRHALEAAGASMQDVVKINTYSTHPDWRKVLMDVRTDYFTPPYPASTGVVVPSLANPDAIFEVEVIAVVPDASGGAAPQYLDPPTISRSAIYSQVVRAGNLVFVAGQCAHVPSDGAPTRDHPLIGVGDPLVQARQCYQNVQYALEAAGAAPRDVVKLNTYSTHPDYRKILNDARPEFFAPPYPASTGVVVSALFKPEALFEVEAIAVVDA
jgi:enamine deaminase RidA (YjgF/YER057c/UK114 family)